MTLVSDIIRQAYRESNLIPIVATPTAPELAEGLARLNALLASVLGYEMGEQLQPLPVGQNNVTAPVGYPAWTPTTSWWAPLNVRLVCNLLGAQSVNLSPCPQDGSRIAVQDASGNFAANPLTIVGNGRLIEGATSITLNTNGLNAEWVFRADLGDWRRVTDVATTDQMPYPQAFDDLFITMLAMRLNPRHGQTMTPESMAALERSREQFRARYHQTIPTAGDPGVLNLSRQTYQQGGYGSTYGPKSDFLSGGGF